MRELGVDIVRWYPCGKSYLVCVSSACPITENISSVSQKTSSLCPKSDAVAEGHLSVIRHRGITLNHGSKEENVPTLRVNTFYDTIIVLWVRRELWLLKSWDPAHGTSVGSYRVTVLASVEVGQADGS